MARDTLSPWRHRARVVIDRVVEERRGEEPEAVLRAVRAAYPFGPREHHPYKCWLAEVRLLRERLLGVCLRTPLARVTLSPPRPTGDALLGALCAAAAAEPADCGALSPLLDYLSEHYGVEVPPPDVEDVARRLYGSRAGVVHVGGQGGGVRWEARVIERHGGRVDSAARIEDAIAGRLLLVEPELRDAITIERTAAALRAAGGERGPRPDTTE